MAAVAPSPAALIAWPAAPALTSPANRREARAHPDVRRNVAALVQRDHPVEELGVRQAPDVHEDSLGRQSRRLAGGEIPHADAVHARVAEDLLDDALRPDLDMPALRQEIRVRRLAAEGLGGIHEHDTHVVAHELERLEEGRVSAADHHDELAAVQRTVAAGAMAQAVSSSSFSRGRLLAWPRPRCDDDGARGDLAGVGDHSPAPLRGSTRLTLSSNETPAAPPARGASGRARTPGLPRGSLEVLDALGVEDAPPEPRGRTGSCPAVPRRKALRSGRLALRPQRRFRIPPARAATYETGSRSSGAPSARSPAYPATGSRSGRLRP